MGHMLAEEGRAGILRDFHDLSGRLLDPSVDFETKIDRLLSTETGRFDLPYGFLTRVDLSGDVQEIVAAEGDHDLLQSGETGPLSESYCRKTVTRPDGSMRVSDALEEGWGDDPAYERFGLGSYVGSTVETSEDVYGTICFASSTPREEPISEDEVLLVDFFAQWVGYELTPQPTRPDVARGTRQVHDLAEIVSHDLRNPLSVASGQLTLLDETVQESIDRIEEAHTRMERIVEDMLTLTRLDTPVTDPSRIDLGKCVAGAWEMVVTDDATLETDVDATHLCADRERLDRLFENLFRNATAYGGDAVTVRVGRLPEGFYVEDDGPGIPESDRDSVFDPGYSTASEGTGFGLSIVRQIADAHDWDVAVTESGGGGARFEVTGIDSIGS